MVRVSRSVVTPAVSATSEHLVPIALLYDNDTYDIE